MCVSSRHRGGGGGAAKMHNIMQTSQTAKPITRVQRKSARATRIAFHRVRAERSTQRATKAAQTNKIARYLSHNLSKVRTLCARIGYNARTCAFATVRNCVQYNILNVCNVSSDGGVIPFVCATTKTTTTKTTTNALVHTHARLNKLYPFEWGVYVCVCARVRSHRRGWHIYIFCLTCSIRATLLIRHPFVHIQMLQ